jgi:hypothetical protein
MKKVAVLFARSDSVYKGFDLADVYDIERDARNYSGNFPVVAHPPCRAWGRLRAFAKPCPDERDLALFAVNSVRRFGGVLEHPAGSTLWDDANLPRPGACDRFGGYTLPINQYDFGHRAKKSTWLYIVGCPLCKLPDLPIVLGSPSHVVGGSGICKGNFGWRPEVTKVEREHTPFDLASWLLDLASKVAL